MTRREPKYKISELSMQDYFKSVKEKITAMENWQDRTDEIVDSFHELAPSIPKKALQQAYMKRRKLWMTVSDEQFNKLFEQM
jgi:hypothetical protein